MFLSIIVLISINKCYFTVPAKANYVANAFKYQLNITSMYRAKRTEDDMMISCNVMHMLINWPGYIRFCSICLLDFL